MKLSEILKDWPEELENIWYQASGQDCYPIEDAYKDGKCVGFNKAIKYCDREIDREELEEILMNPSNSKENNINFGVNNDYKARYLANAIISTMPKWLKPTERK